jgi:flavin-dependent dehydrogenase
LYRFSSIRGSTIITIYGAGLAGLTAAITLAREGKEVTVYEKEEQVGGSKHCTPSVHMTPVHFQNMKEFIGIDVEPCFSELNRFKAYIYSRIVHFNPRHLYVTERGPNKTSLDYYLYEIAKREGVTFEFSHPLNPDTLNSLPTGSIIATGSYSCLFNDLNLPYTPFLHFDSHMKTKEKDAFCVAYFDSYIAGYGYGYVAAKDGFVSVEVDFSQKQPYEKHLQRFKIQLKETEQLDFGTWSLVKDNIPRHIHLFRRRQGKTFVLAGAIGGFHDPFFGFGVNSALISGKIAALATISKKRGIQEFKRFTTTLQKMFLLSKIYNHIPLKTIMIPQIMKRAKGIIPIIGENLQSIPGFTHKDCFIIINNDMIV